MDSSSTGQTSDALNGQGNLFDSEYNPIFEKLVLTCEENSADRLIGLLAYADYKLEKCNWVKSANSKGMLPDVFKARLDGFLLHCMSEKALRDYQARALYTLTEYADAYAQKVLNQKVEEKVNEEIVSRITKSIVDNRTTFIMSIWQSFVASIFFAIFLFFFGLSIRLALPESNIAKSFNTWLPLMVTT